MRHAQTFIFLIILALVCSFSAIAQNPGETHLKIRAAVENRNYEQAINELKTLEQKDKKIFALNNYDYLLARMAEKKGDYAQAMANYEAVVKRNSALSEYALWHLSQIARASGNLMLEKIYLRQLSTFAGQSLLANAAAMRTLKSEFESGNFEAVVSGAERWSAVGSKATNSVPQPAANNQAANDARTREILVYRGQALLRLKRVEEAREVFTRLVTVLPNPGQPDDFALAGVRGLDEIEVGTENLGVKVSNLADGEHFRRATIYQFNRDFTDARLHYAALIGNSPLSTFAPDAMYQTGRGYAQELKFDDAVKWFERVQAEFPDKPLARDALSQSAAAYSRINKPKEAVARYQKFIVTYKDAENLDRAYLNIIDIERDAGRNEEALKWTRTTREVFKGKLADTLALFAQIRIRLAQNDWSNALLDLSELQTMPDLGGTRVPGGTNTAEVSFLKGFVLENLARFPEAIDVYLSIPDGRGEYYGWRATERLRNLANDAKAKSFVAAKIEQLKTPPETLSPEINRKTAQALYRLTNNAVYLETLRFYYANLPNYKTTPSANLLEFGRREVLKQAETSQKSVHQTLADELLFLGLYDEGTPELEAVLKAESGARNAESTAENPNAKSQTPNFKFADIAYTLAVFYRRGDWANRAVAYAEPLWKNVPADYQIELIPRDQIELLYPAPYADALLKSAPSRNVDPRFALSIMRQESRYRADVKSYAAARGLMQFISTTAMPLAGELQIKDFRQDDLYDPPTAILFGSQYLSNLFKMFPAQSQAVAASYNGGETNVARWMARSKSDEPDRYVPEILFTQSKDYVYKVMANYRVYRTFYDENLRAK